MWEVPNSKPVFRPASRSQLLTVTYGDAFLTNEALLCGQHLLLFCWSWPQVVFIILSYLRNGADLLMTKLPKDLQLLKSLQMEADFFNLRHLEVHFCQRRSKLRTVWCYCDATNWSVNDLVCRVYLNTCICASTGYAIRIVFNMFVVLIKWIRKWYIVLLNWYVESIVIFDVCIIYSLFVPTLSLFSCWINPVMKHPFLHNVSCVSFEDKCS